MITLSAIQKISDFPSGAKNLTSFVALHVGFCLWVVVMNDVSHFAAS